MPFSNDKPGSALRGELEDREAGPARRASSLQTGDLDRQCQMLAICLPRLLGHQKQASNERLGNHTSARLSLPEPIEGDSERRPQLAMRHGPPWLCGRRLTNTSEVILTARHMLARWGTRHFPPFDFFPSFPPQRRNRTSLVCSRERAGR